MHFHAFGLYLGLLFISINAEFMDDGVEVEDLSENAEESDANEGEHPSGVRLLRNESQILPVQDT
jgi:calmegin